MQKLFKIAIIFVNECALMMCKSRLFQMFLFFVVFFQHTFGSYGSNILEMELARASSAYRIT